jgi:hypothetical protein
MRLYYQTEFRLGERGRRISRRYTGAQALAAIIIDLSFKLWLELVVALVGLAAWFCALAFRFALLVAAKSWKTAVALMTVVVYLLTLPFALLHQAVDRVLAKNKQGQPGRPTGPYLKPEWALGREV